MRILLADDHPLFVEALQILIERSIPGSQIAVVTGLDAARSVLAGPQHIDLAIIDLHMPDSHGFEGIERTLREFPATPILVISGTATPADVSRAIALGAKGFLPKNLPGKVIEAALQVVVSGGTYVPAEYVRASPAEPVGTLTPRETQVLTLLAGGQSNKEIGRALDLQEITVKLHVRNIFRKLGVRNRVEAANLLARKL
jgi:DNA-binding NarL/FixJ family response regulator